MEIDASDFALGAILSQMGENEKIHPFAFYSKKLFAAEINYEIHHKVLFVNRADAPGKKMGRIPVHFPAARSL